MTDAVAIRIANLVCSENVAVGSREMPRGRVRAIAVLTLSSKVNVIDWNEDWKEGRGMGSLDESASGIFRWIRYVLQESFTCTPIWKS
jgi:hypothetical protein